jgi:hypothetical protein
VAKVETTNEQTRRESGNVVSERPLVCFRYLLMRDHLFPGELEKVVMDIEMAETAFIFTNGGLADYAENLAKRLADRQNSRECN